MIEIWNSFGPRARQRKQSKGKAFGCHARVTQSFSAVCNASITCALQHPLLQELWKDQRLIAKGHMPLRVTSSASLHQICSPSPSSQQHKTKHPKITAREGSPSFQHHLHSARRVNTHTHTVSGRLAKSTPSVPCARIASYA